MRTFATVLVATACLGLGATASSGQVADEVTRWIVELVPIVAKLEVGARFESTITATDYRTMDGVWVQAFELEGMRDQPLMIDVGSREIDGVLTLIGPGLSVPVTDDDSGEGCNPRIRTFLPASGTYRLIVGALGAGGDYVVQLGGAAEVPPSEGCGQALEALASDEVDADELLRVPVVGVLTQDEGRQGSLTEDDVMLASGARGEAWWISSGSRATLTLDVGSESLDAYLYLMSEDGMTFETDDDAGGRCDARITVSLRAGERRRVVVSSFPDGPGIGPYAIRLSRYPEPPREGNCLPIGG